MTCIFELIDPQSTLRAGDVQRSPIVLVALSVKHYALHVGTRGRTVSLCSSIEFADFNGHCGQLFRCRGGLVTGVINYLRLK